MWIVWAGGGGKGGRGREVGGKQLICGLTVVQAASAWKISRSEYWVVW